MPGNRNRPQGRGNQRPRGQHGNRQHGQGGGNRNNDDPGHIKSPYNFVPLAEKVFIPNDTAFEPIDVPYKDGLSGIINLRVTAKTPIYIRNAGIHPEGNSPEETARLKRADENYQSFYTLPDGTPAIPGTSIKGMLRSVLAIATFSRIKTSVKNQQRKISQAHRKQQCWDVAQTLFGTVDEDTLRGRVQAEAFISNSNTKVLNTTEEILNSPKPTFYPNYVRQQGNAHETGRLQENEYRTYQNNDARIRGWKRYPIAGDEHMPKPNSPSGSNERLKLKTWFKPLSAGAEFTGKLHFHNLRPWELGALLWTITFGQSPENGKEPTWHSLGMAKPLGYGSVSIAIDSIEAVNACNNEKEVDIKDYLDKFLGLINPWLHERLGKLLHETEQYRELLAMANPDNFKNSADTLKYPEDVRKFADYKGESLVLA